jgi:hypothetical protein
MTEWGEYQRELMLLDGQMECQKWQNITRKFGVMSPGLYIGLVLSGADP